MLTTRSNTHRRFGLLAVLSVLAVMAVSACSGESVDVATLGDRGSRDGALAQGDTARAMVVCLQEAGLPVEYSDADESVFFTVTSNQPFQYMHPSGGLTVFSNTANEAEMNKWQQKWQEFNEQRWAEFYDEEQSFDQLSTDISMTDNVISPPEYTLYIGETDYSDALLQCVEQTGYTSPAEEPIATDDLEWYRAQAKVGAEWARCARENGFPSVSDPEPPTVGNSDAFQAYVSLPETITLEELRALLEACPNFDREAHEAYEKAIEDPNVDWESLDYPISPLIDIAAPDDLAWENPNDPAVQQYQALLDLLAEAEAAHYGEEGAEGATVATLVG